MAFIIGLLTVVLTLDCAFLMLLIIMQLPKKEAGMGTAFGGGTTDALFGSGSGNALTQLTKYAAVVFFVLSFILSVVNANKSQEKSSRIKAALRQQAAAAAAQPAATSSNLLEKTTQPGSNAISLMASNVASNIVAAISNQPTKITNMMVLTNFTMFQSNKPLTLSMSNPPVTPLPVKPAATPSATNRPAGAK